MFSKQGARRRRSPVDSPRPSTVPGSMRRRTGQHVVRVVRAASPRRWRCRALAFARAVRFAGECVRVRAEREAPYLLAFARGWSGEGPWRHVLVFGRGLALPIRYTALLASGELSVYRAIAGYTASDLKRYSLVISARRCFQRFSEQPNRFVQRVERASSPRHVAQHFDGIAAELRRRRFRPTSRHHGCPPSSSHSSQTESGQFARSLVFVKMNLGACAE